MSKNQIYYYNRAIKKKEMELVYGDGAIKFIYSHPLGKIFSRAVASKPLTQFYGSYQDLKVSRKKVPPFVKKFNIDLNEYKAGSVKSDKKEESYKSFNEFFIREFEDGQRNFIQDSDKMPAFCEARYFGYGQMNDIVKVPVKGKFLNANDLLGNSKWGETFKEGPLLIARLCPVDYHRYHYPLDGKTIDSFQISGQYHSVNPLALKVRENIFLVNERRASVLETKDFGKIAYIEVGAAMVGKIIQSHDESQSFKRGDEKGYFLFGGSTVIVLGEKGKWKPSEDILENTREGVETYLKLGDEIASIQK